MNISPANAGVPAVMLSVNPPTEQVARDNRVREKIVSTRKTSANIKEPPVNKEEKQLRKPAWDPAEHIDYAHPSKDGIAIVQDALYSNELLNNVSSMISGSDFLPKEVNGYAVNMQLPQKVLDSLEKLKDSKRTGAVVAMRYRQSSAANMPTEVLIVI